MSPLTVQSNLPKDLLEVLNVPETQLETQILKLVALGLFRQERISTGKGAELLGIKKWEFIQLLAQHNIPYFTESPTELTTELEAVRNRIRS